MLISATVLLSCCQSFLRHLHEYAIYIRYIYICSYIYLHEYLDTPFNKQGLMKASSAFQGMF